MTTTGPTAPVPRPAPGTTSLSHTLEALGGGRVTTTLLGAPTTFVVSETSYGVEAAFSWQWLALYGGVALVVFVLTSRLWRLWRRPEHV